MKKFYLRGAAILFFVTNAYAGFAQTSGITSGSIYTLKSVSSNKILDVSNASMDDGATVDTWTDTKSDAQRWIVTNVSKDVYTLTNVGSGKFLHVSATPADSIGIDQVADAGTDAAKWVIKKAASGIYYLQSAADPKFALTLNGGNTADGSKVSVSKADNVVPQKWAFTKVTAQDGALNPAVVAKSFDAWYDQFKVETKKGFWDQAEMMEIVLDAYEVTKDVRYKNKFDALYTNFIANHKEDWGYNNYNDDITWAVLFSVRGYLLTGNKTYLDKAKDQYDKMYARAFSNTYGGGLIWFQGKTSKNACIEGPAAVAACYLAKATGDKTYYDKAIALYSWSKIYLFDASNGKVSDNVDLDKRSGKLKFSHWSSTYNQGTFLGAAVMLYNYTKEYTYLEEAERIAKYSRDEMFKGKTMNNEEGDGGDLPGFKGIFARYARMYTQETKKTDLVDWLQLNAKVAYNNRNSKGVMRTLWATRAPEDSNLKKAFGYSTAVSLLVNTMPLAKAE